MTAKAQTPHLSYGIRARLRGLDQHPKAGEVCTIIKVLPNPSGRAEHQWYDVRFADCSLGRFLEKYLVPADNQTAAA